MMNDGDGGSNHGCAEGYEYVDVRSFTLGSFSMGWLVNVLVDRGAGALLRGSDLFEGGCDNVTLLEMGDRVRNPVGFFKSSVDR